MDPNEIRLEPTDVGELCERVVSSWSSVAGPAKLDLVVEAGPSHRCMLPAVPFTQALLDLLDNAAEATAGRVLLRVSCRPQLCMVSVEDEGPGWPDVVRANLGQPFLTLKPQGTGLGLYNAHSLAMALGGELRLEEREGGGAIAVFALPCDDDSLSDRP